MKQGQESQALYQIIRGSCTVESAKEDGTSSVQLGKMRKGEIFGELTFLFGGTVSVSVVSQQCDVMIVSRLALQKFFKTQPSLSPKFYCYLASQIANRLRSKEAHEEAQLVSSQDLAANTLNNINRTFSGSYSLRTSTGRPAHSMTLHLESQKLQKSTPQLSMPELKSTLPSLNFTPLDTNSDYDHPQSPVSSRSNTKEGYRTVRYSTMKAPPKLDLPSTK